MKKLVAKKDAQCMACLQCVTACSRRSTKQADVTLSCIRSWPKAPVLKTQHLHSVRQVYALLQYKVSPRIPKTGIVHDQQEEVRRLRQVRRGLPHGGHGSQGNRFQVHCLRHLPNA